jgi:predicted phosphodiesterase
MKTHKTIILGDTHGHDTWKQAIEQEKPDRVVFIGDYFDSFSVPGLDQIHNFKEIIKHKESNQQEIILLIGNHDYHYYPEIGYNGTSGYQSGLAPNIVHVVNENRHHLQMCYKMDEFLFTHAGVSNQFMNEVFGEDGWDLENVDSDLNELFKHKPLAFEFNPYDRSGYGDHTGQTPLWIRPTALIKANREHELKKKYIQVVGHTHMKYIDIEGKSTGGRYYFIDTMPKEYLVIIDGVVSLGKL